MQGTLICTPDELYACIGLVMASIDRQLTDTGK